MKKFLAIGLSLAMLLSLAACGSQAPGTAAPTQAPATAAPTTAAPATEAPTTVAPTTEAPTTEAPTTEAPTTEAPTTEAPTTEAPTTEAPTTEAPTEAPEPEVIHTLHVLNPILEDLKPVSDPGLTLYNTYWLNGYNVATFAAKHFWNEPKDEEPVKIISYVDQYMYAEEITYQTLKDQALVLELPDALKENYTEGMVAGYGIVKNQFPYHVGYIICGPETILLACQEGYVAKYLFEDIKMVEADAYDFICADGFSETIDKEDLEKVEIFFKDDRVDATSIAYEGYTLQDILYIVPEGVTSETKDMELEEGVTYKITVTNTAVKGKDTDCVASFGGTLQTGYAVPEILEAAEIDSQNATTEVKAVSLLESPNTTMEMADFLKKYIVPNDSKDRGAYTVGPEQQYGDVTINVGCYIIEDNSLLWVPESATQENGLALADLLGLCGFEGYTAIRVICADGFSEEIDAEDLKGVAIFHIDGRIDTNSVAWPEYTLQNAVAIEVLK